MNSGPKVPTTRFTMSRPEFEGVIEERYPDAPEDIIEKLKALGIIGEKDNNIEISNLLLKIAGLIPKPNLKDCLYPKASPGANSIPVLSDILLQKS